MNKAELKETVSYKPFLILYWSLTAVFSALSVLLSDVFVPLAVAFYSTLILFERSEKRIASVSLGALMLIALSLVNPAFSLFALEIILMSVLIVLYFKRGRSKTECALLLTVTATVFTVLALLFAAFQNAGEYTLAAAVEYYQGIYEELKATFVETVSSMVATMEDGTYEFPFTAEGAEEMFNTFATMLISMLVIVGFAFAGVSLKLTLALGTRVAKDPTPFRIWEFEVPSLYAYFYLVLMLLSFFMTGDSVPAITVLNLYYIFFAVFGYLGLKYSYRILLRIRKRRGSAILILVLALVLFSTFAVQFLALMGAYMTITRNRRISPNIPKD